MEITRKCCIRCYYFAIRLTFFGSRFSFLDTFGLIKIRQNFDSRRCPTSSVTDKCPVPQDRIFSIFIYILGHFNRFYRSVTCTLSFLILLSLSEFQYERFSVTMFFLQIVYVFCDVKSFDWVPKRERRKIVLHSILSCCRRSKSEDAAAGVCLRYSEQFGLVIGHVLGLAERWK